MAIQERKNGWPIGRRWLLIFEILWGSAIFFVLYLGFIGLFFWGFKYFKKILDEESSQKEKDENKEDR